MNEKLEKAKNEIAKEYGYESFEQFDDKSTFGYDHAKPGIIDKIAERYHSLMSEAKPISSENIKIGTKLIAIDECKMEFGDGNALIIGKSYKVNNIINNYIVIKSELCNVHEFEINELHEFFNLLQTPKQ